MDTYLLNQYSEKFSRLNIRLDPYLINKIGILKDEMVLRVENYYINCIPFELSLKHCKAIVIFSARELSFFDQFMDRRHALHMKFLNPIFPREISLYVKSSIRKVDVLNKKGNQALIELDFHSPSNDFQEIMVDLFLRVDKIQAFIRDPKNAGKKVPGPSLKEVYIDDHAYARWEGKEKESAKILSVTMRNLVVFREIRNPEEFKQRTGILIEFHKGALHFSVAGTAVSMEPLENIPDHYIITLNIKASFSLCDALSSLLNIPLTIDDYSGAAVREPNSADGSGSPDSEGDRITDSES